MFFYAVLLIFKPKLCNFVFKVRRASYCALFRLHSKAQQSIAPYFEIQLGILGMKIRRTPEKNILEFKFESGRPLLFLLFLAAVSSEVIGNNNLSSSLITNLTCNLIIKRHCSSRLGNVALLGKAELVTSIW